MMRFTNRQQAGKLLADKLAGYKGQDVVVLALPRGGIVLGAEIAAVLGAPLGIVHVRKIAHPSSPEFAIGAVAEDDEPLMDEYEQRVVDQMWLRQAITDARDLIKYRRELYGIHNGINVKDKTVVLVDDGIATGLTMLAAIRQVHKQGAKSIVVAVPVSAAECIEVIGPLVDDIVILDNPQNFLGAVGAHYDTFEQVSDDEVKRLLHRSDYPNPRS